MKIRTTFLSDMIKPKKKPCKGINRAKDFKGCGELRYRVKYGLCRDCLKEWIYSTGEGAEYLKRNVIPKAKKEVKAKQKEKDNKLIQDLTNWKKKLQTEVQKTARLIDFGLGCLARDYVPNQMHGGHIFSKGAYSNIRFDLHNIHRQSAQSNHFQNEDGLLREKLESEYGTQYYENLKQIRNREQVKYTNKDYMDFYLKCRAINRKLEKENAQLNKPRTVEERIKLRKNINEELGIYNN